MEKLGIKGSNLNYHAGIGWVIIPKGIDVDLYQKNIFETNRVTITDGTSIFFDVLVDKEKIQQLKIPNNYDELGSPVVWINIPEHDTPVIIGVLENEEEFKNNLHKDNKKINEISGNKIVEIDLDAKKGSVVISASNGEGVITLKTNNENNDSTIQLNSNILNVENDELNLITSKLNIGVIDDEGVIQKLIKVDSEKITIEDNFQNKIEITDNGINVDSKQIVFQNGEQSAVLGEKLEDILSQLIDAITSITVTTPVGQSGTPVNTPAFQMLKQKLFQLKSTKFKIS